jgi:hypothetical protein
VAHVLIGTAKHGVRRSAAHEEARKHGKWPDGFVRPVTSHSTYASAQEIRDRIVRNEVSATEVMAEPLSRMEALEPTLNAFVTSTPERAMEAARGIAGGRGDEPQDRFAAPRRGLRVGAALGELQT